jgi:hypothetical protein
MLAMNLSRFTSSWNRPAAIHPTRKPGARILEYDEHNRSFQSSPRSGFMDVELKDGHVVITSQAVIVLEGRMSI